MIEERAVRLAVGTMFTYQHVLAMLRDNPAMTDEEAAICLQVAQNGYEVAMLQTLQQAVGIFVKVRGEEVEYSGNSRKPAVC